MYPATEPRNTLCNTDRTVRIHDQWATMTKTSKEETHINCKNTAIDLQHNGQPQDRKAVYNM